MYIDQNFTNIYEKMKDRRKQRERVDCYTDTALNFLVSMIDIKGFEETGLNEKVFQYEKYASGMVGLHKADSGSYVICSCTQKGLPNNSLQPKEVIATYYDNQRIFCEELEVDKDIVLLFNTPLMNEETDAYRVAAALANTDNSIMLNIKYARYLPLLLARNDKEKRSFEEALKRMDKGETVVIGDNELVLDDLLSNVSRETMLNITDVRNADMIQYLLEASDNFKRMFYNKYGLYTSGNAKHAQQSKMEIDNGESAAWVYPLLYLRETDEFCKRANKLYDLNLDAVFSPLWTILWQKFVSQNTITEETVNSENVTKVAVESENVETETTESEVEYAVQD